jgi:hypothetical protein
MLTRGLIWPAWFRSIARLWPCGRRGEATPLWPAMAAALAFGLIVFVTIRHVPDCRSPHRSISIGDVVLLAGCGRRPMTN